MNNPLRQIRDAEEQAKVIIKDALAYKDQVVNSAEKKVIEELNLLKEEENNKAKIRLEQKKAECTKVFEKINNEAQAEADALSRKAESSLPGVHQMIVQAAQDYVLGKSI